MKSYQSDDEQLKDEQNSSENSEIISNKEEAVKFDRIEGGKISIPEGAGVIDTIVSRSADDLRPWSSITLPSHGRYYEGEIPDGVVRVRSMGMAADKILATQRLAQSGKSLDYLFKNCVDLPRNFSPLSLLAGDRIFLLYYLRGITHGNIYEFMIECTNCEAKTSLESDLNNIEIIWDNAALGEEPFKVPLKYISDVTGHDVWVKVRFLRGYDLLQMTKQVKKGRRLRPNKKFQEENMDNIDDLVIDETLATNLSNLIVEVGSDAGDSTSEKSVISRFVDRLHSSDHAAIRDFLNENSPSINTEVSVECEHCGHEMTMPLPITESFFRPQK